MVVCYVDWILSSKLIHFENFQKPISVQHKFMLYNFNELEMTFYAGKILFFSMGFDTPNFHEIWAIHIFWWKIVRMKILLNANNKIPFHSRKKCACNRFLLLHTVFTARNVLARIRKSSSKCALVTVQQIFRQLCDSSNEFTVFRAYFIKSEK